MEILLTERLAPKRKARIINSFDKNNVAPLHYAARYDHDDIVKLLIKHGANLNIKAEDGLTPLHYCARYVFSPQ